MRFTRLCVLFHFDCAHTYGSMVRIFNVTDGLLADDLISSVLINGRMKNAVPLSGASFESYFAHIVPLEQCAKLLAANGFRIGAYIKSVVYLSKKCKNKNSKEFSILFKILSFYVKLYIPNLYCTTVCLEILEKC